MENNYEVKTTPVRMNSFYHLLKRNAADPMAVLEDLCACNCHYTIGRLLPHDPAYPRQKVESVGIPGCLNYQMPGLCQPVNDGGSEILIFRMASVTPMRAKEGAILNLVPVCEIPEQLLAHRAFWILICGSDAFPMQRFFDEAPELPTELKLDVTRDALEHLLYHGTDSADELDAFFELCNVAIHHIANGTFTPEEVLDEFRFKGAAELLEESLATLKQKAVNSSGPNHAKAAQSTKRGRKQKEALRKIHDGYRANA